MNSARSAAVLIFCVALPLMAAESSTEPVRRRAAGGPSQADIWRFLEQTSWGPTEALANRVGRIGFEAFLEEQFRAPMSSYPDVPTQRSIPPPSCDATCLRDHYTTYPLQRRFFTNALYGEDQLRQRVAWALHKIFVVSGVIINEPKAMTPYLQILDRNAFGNFSQLLHEITLNPAMGAYLNMVTSTKTKPNENFAREILQLFSIGTVALNPDGTPRLDARGRSSPTYDQAVVDGFTKVFTGWTFAERSELEDRNDAVPMVPGSGTHDESAKTLLNDVVLPAGQSTEKDLNDALEVIFHHPNVGPFICRQLIQSLVTSNPSPAYVQRVAAAFDDNGSGIRGDLKAVVRAIVLDPEARNQPTPDREPGHLKEPVLLITNMLRAFPARSADGRRQSDGSLNHFTARLGQDVFRPASVFSYYPPDFAVPGQPEALAPEFGIVSGSTAMARANVVNSLVFDGVRVSPDAPDGTSLDFSAIEPLAGDASQLVAALNRLLMHGTMSAAMRDRLVAAVEVVPSSDSQMRVRQAVYLVCTSWQYQVQR
jgi:uncharacterized protein (DUF1800 family)